ncbi:receptor protein kinase-like protein ZAR1 [Chenopodium quinoa]|uniref:Protein kinase domain-containing protein n=1 Tax=Chenopodium quinoa TaxID=63459 RepID=A0A803M6R1_CHEQI|nr:receptor protein kinase-like protein ZAR1 [Chenopodium quinoa]
MNLQFFLCSFLLLFTITSRVYSLSPDGLALLSLKSAVDHSSSSAVFADWDENDPDPCGWTGVSCDGNSTTSPNPRVVGISVAGKNLRGYIPSELGSLTFLRRLNLHGNSFYGSIPDQIFNATSLHSIFLYGNNLSGPLPTSMCSLPKIQNVDVSGNSLSGEIPNGLKECKQLQRLILARNNFSGELPGGIWHELVNLVQLDLSSNQIQGKIPEQLGELKSLSGTLNLSFNHLSGKIPKSLGDLPMTVSFDLRANNLSGEIPQTGSFANQGPTAFLGNPLLCGFPLQKDCTKTTTNPNSPPPEDSRGISPKRKGLSPGLILLISAADAVVVAFVGLVLVYYYWKKKDHSSGCSCTGTIKLGRHMNKDKKTGLCFGCFRGGSTSNDIESESDKGSSEGGEGGGEGEGELVAIDKGFTFELDELLRASAYVLGKSGLGIVYKVVLGNGVPVAVRRLGEGGDQQRYKEFVAEIQAIGKIKHPNVVKLRAYYWAPDEKLLISDFISNGNLGNALRGRTGQPSTSLTWKTRLKIAKGTARGLAYLHECSPRKFVHGDIKPSNILLDNEFRPHISDFGLNRLISIAGNNPSSSGGFMGGALPYVKSTSQEKINNYRAPEAKIPGSRPTQKWDVYSFGVVVLELLTGKSPEHSSPTTSTSTEVHDLVKWVRMGFEEENPLSEMVDPMLLQEVHAKKEVLAAFHVALSCTESDPEVRPRMKNVSENLDKIGS